MSLVTRPLVSISAFLLFSVGLYTPLIGLADSKNLKLEEVIVTARKRDDVISEVPISISAVSGQTLKDQNILKLEDLIQSIPNVHIGEAAVNNQLFIRGVGSGVNKGFEQTVGTYVDGVYYGRDQLSRIPLFDIERIEVLKGPQGILFGKNTVAGAVSITTADPSEEFGGQISALYEGELNEHNIDGAISGPLSDKVRGRFAFRTSGMDGWLKNGLTGDDQPETSENVMRFGLAFDPIDDVAMLFKYTTGSFDSTGRNHQIAQCSATFSGLLAANNVVDDCTSNHTTWTGGPTIISKDTLSAVDFGDEVSKNDYDTVSFVIDWTLPNDLQFTSLTTYAAYDTVERVDLDQSALGFIRGDLDENFDQWAQEFRVVSPQDEEFEYLFGAYFEWADLDLIRSTNINYRIYNINAPLTSNEPFSQDSETQAAFTQGTWNVYETWSLIAGLRYSWEEKSAEKIKVNSQLGSNTQTTDLGLLGVAASAVGPGAAFSIEDDRVETNWSPSFTVQHTYGEENMAYFTVSKGFKGGGYDAALTTNSFDDFEFDPESVVAYELGSKLRLLDGAAQLNFALFSSTFKDVQVSTFNGATAFNVGNAGEILTQGFEFDGRVRVIESTEIGMSASLLDSSYEEFETAACYALQTVAEGCIGSGSSKRQDLSGKETQFSPNYSFSLYMDNQVNITDGLVFSSLFEIIRSDEYSIANDLDPFFYQDAYTKVNWRLALSDNDNIWQLALIGKNLTDKDTISWGNDVPTLNGTYFVNNDRPRTVAVQIQYKF